MKVRLTLSAQAQLKAAVEYIRRDKPSAAAAFSEKAKARLKRLEDFPDSGRRVPEYPDSQVREVVVPPYRFFYQQRENTIWVLAVWHEAQVPDEPTE